MQNVLFTYRRKISDTQTNDNYINPLNVVSAYWSINDKEKRVLSVFLVNGFNIVFNEAVGERFITHLEDFLRYHLGGRIQQVTQDQTAPNTRPQRNKRNLTPAEVVEDEEVVEVQGDPATWAAQN